MAACASRNGTRNVAAVINMTPLVDVMLVLLMIFMLAAPLTAQRIPLSNSSVCQIDCPRRVEPIRLAIKRTGELYWDGAAISRAALATNLGALSRLPLAPALEIHVEARVRYALVTEVLAAAHNAAVHQISIAPARD